MGSKKNKTNVTTADAGAPVIHVGERVKKIAIEKGIHVDDMAKWFVCERSNMYHKLKVRDWKMSDILIAAGHLNVAPYLLMTDGKGYSGTITFNSDSEAHHIKDLEAQVKALTIENGALKDKLIKYFESKN